MSDFRGAEMEAAANRDRLAAKNARIAQLEAALREVMEQCPEHVPYGLAKQIRALVKP